ELLLRRGKVVGDARTKIWERAARENKRERQRLPFEIAQAHRLAQFIGKVVIGHQIARVQRINFPHATEVLRAERCHRRGAAGFPDLLDPTVLLSHHHTKRDLIPGLEVRQFFGIFDIKRHRHWLHVIGNFFVLDLDPFSRWQNFSDYAVDLKSLLLFAGHDAEAGHSHDDTDYKLRPTHNY